MRSDFAQRSVFGVALITIFYKNRGETNQIVTGLWGACGLKGDAQRLTLPDRRRASRLRVVFRIPPANFFSEQRLACSYLCDNRVKLASARIQSAISSIVAKPDKIGDGRIVVR